MSRCSDRALLSNWLESQRITELWRAKKASLRESTSSPFSCKMTESHRVDPLILMEFLALRSLAVNRTILDVGCGGGFRASQFSPASYIGIDVSTASARTGAALVRGMAELMPFRTGAADLVLCIDALDHMIDPERALSEMLRVAARGAHVYITVADSSAEEFRLHKRSRAMFGVPEMLAHLHNFDSEFFNSRLADAFARLQILRSKGLLFIHAQEKRN